MAYDGKESIDGSAHVHHRSGPPERAASRKQGQLKQAGGGGAGY